MATFFNSLERSLRRVDILAVVIIIVAFPFLACSMCTSLLILFSGENVVALEVMVPVNMPTLTITSRETAVVTKVIDGDTIEVNLNGETVRVGYIGIKAPEYDAACGIEAAQANATLVTGRTIHMVKDVSQADIFGRLLRYVYVDDMMINAELVSRGWATPVRHSLDTTYANYFESLQAYAVEPPCKTVQTPQPPTPPPPLPPPAIRNTPNDGIQSQPPGQSLPNDLPATVQGICTCTGPDLDCEDFNTHAEAQSCYSYCVRRGHGNVYGLDGYKDLDGLACEHLP